MNNQVKNLLTIATILGGVGIAIYAIADLLQDKSTNNKLEALQIQMSTLIKTVEELQEEA